METIKGEIARLSRPEELRPLLASRGPCLSIYFRVTRENLSHADDERRWKVVVRELRAQLAGHADGGSELLQPLVSWDVTSEDRNEKERTLAVFRSPDFFYRIWIRAQLREKVAVGPQFLIRPLLPFLSTPTFYVLALSQNDIRLLRCTLDSSENVALNGAQTNFERYMNSAKPDHVLENRGAAGPSSGSSKGILAGTTTGAEDQGEYLAHFFRQVDRALNAKLRDGNQPVILAGVDFQISLYRTISAYPCLLEESIHGAPNSLKGGELHSRALAVLEQHRQRELKKVVDEYNHLAGGGRATNKLKEIVAAAHDGRVNKLIVSESLEQAGAMNEVTHEVKAMRESERAEYDLLNDAAVQTILHAGRVFTAPNRMMPNGSPLAAIFRY